VTKGRMSDVVDQRKGLGEIFVEAKHGCDGARDLRNFDGVRQPVAEMIGEARRENLRLGFQAAEGARVDDAVTIALEGVAIGMIRFGIAPAAARINGETKALQHDCRATVLVFRPPR